MSDTPPGRGPSTEAELDAALNELHGQVQLTDTGLDRAREALVLAARRTLPHQPAVLATSARSSRTGRARAAAGRGAASRRRRFSRLLLAAAVVAGLVTVGVLAPGWFPGGSNQIPTANAARELQHAADTAITATDPVVPAGQYLYVEEHSWSTSFAGAAAVYLHEDLRTQWVPADPKDPTRPWRSVLQPTGNIQWILGGDEQVQANGGPPEATDARTVDAVCGDYAAVGGGCERPGSWQDPTPTFLDDLPTDPNQLRKLLDTAAPDNSRGDAAVFTYVVDTLASGRVPAAVRAGLYRVLAGLDGVKITDTATTLDGQTGTSFGISDGQIRQDIVIDPATGAYIGQRQVLLTPEAGAPAGTVTGSSSITTAVVASLGEQPDN